MNTNIVLSLDTDVLRRARAAADAAGMSLSAYISRAVRHKMMIEALRQAVALDEQASPDEQADRAAWAADQATHYDHIIDPA